ncbi:methylmalonyl-CoA epimerase [Rubrivirga marina]|uniref:Methylmalonyl-CoA epimerase n=1 Tax=Rubrivirga marina TaxID=1196024 RepID=A0A271J027_9BACT|nr:methylmalonyl-CoA epimerase [Rubrivirga marina]PAP76404.1 methylmalonyl-CoA epimerase [Rubrivirga marina]
MIDARAVHHLGIAVRSLDAHRDYYERVLGARFEGVEEVPDQGVRVAFYAVGPPTAPVRLELLEPTRDDSAVARFLDARGEGLHHVAYAVDDIASRLAALQAGGVRLVDEAPRRGSHDAQIAFLHPTATGGVLTELYEPASGHG